MLGLAVVLPFLVGELEVEPATASLLMPAAYLGCMSTSVLAGSLADRLGGRLVAVGGLLLIAAGVCLAAAAPTFEVFLLGALVTGTGYGTANPATSVLVNAVRMSGRGLQLGIKQAGVTLGGLMGGLLMPPVIHHDGWRTSLFALSAVVVLVAGYLLLGSRRASRDAGPAAVWEPASLRPLSGGFYGLAMSSAQVASFGLLAVYVVDRLSMTPTQGSLLLGVVLGVGVGSRIGWAAWSDRCQRRGDPRPWAGRVLPLRVCASIGLVGFVAMAVPTRATALIGAVLLGLGAAGWNGAYLAAIMPSGGGGGGRTVGRALMFINIGCMIGPALAGGVLALTDHWEPMWLTLAVLQGLALTMARPVLPSGAVTPQGVAAA